ncbi:MAG: carbohydrate kinase [Bacteroidales bacterium]|nr:carbohydrate kinase [Bacteroidales bacterium]
MNKTTQILCFGEILWDNLPSGAVEGGAPMNVALHLSRFGINSSIASSVGNDKKGSDLISFLTKSGLRTDLVQVHKLLPTSEVLVFLDEHNTASYEICEPVAWDEITLTPELINETKLSTAIVFGSLASRNPGSRETLLKLLENDSILKIMDVNLRPPYDTEANVKPLLVKADIVKLNDEELMKISVWYNLPGTLEEIIRSFGKLLNLETLIVTMGKNGAYVLHQDELYHHKGFKVATEDSVGAGDAFLAGFLAAFFDGKDLNTALTEASAIGAFVASQPGATPNYTKEVIKRFTEA